MSLSKSLEPVARRGLGIALSYVGGITLSLLLVPEMPRRPETILIYAVFTAVPLLAFLLQCGEHAPHHGRG